MAAIMKAVCLLSLTEAAKLCPGNPHRNALWRWIRYGILLADGGRLRLDHWRVGGALFTTEDALNRFFAEAAERDKAHFEALDQKPQPAPAPRAPKMEAGQRSSAEIEAADRRAARALAKA